MDLPWGSVRALRFSQDPGLPTLAAVLAVNPTARVLRYRPHHRCTMRVGDRFAKVFRDGRGTRLYDEGLALWQATNSEDPALMPREAVSAGFLRGFADVSGALEPALVTACRAHKRLAKAEQTARKPSRHAVARAMRHLAAARQMLVTDGLVAAEPASHGSGLG